MYHCACKKTVVCQKVSESPNKVRLNVVDGESESYNTSVTAFNRNLTQCLEDIQIFSPKRLHVLLKMP